MRLFYIGIYNNFEPQMGMRRSLRGIATEYSEIDWVSFKKSYGKNFGAALIQKVNGFKPDIIFMQIQTPDVITPEIAKQLNGFKVNWTGDVRENIDWYIDVAPYVNVTLFTNMDDVYTLRKKKLKADFLQVSVDEKIYKPDGKYVEFAPIVFFGNNYGKQFPLSEYRYNIVTQLKRDYGNQFAIFGSGWNGLEAGNLNGKQEQEAMILRGAKIALSISHFDRERYFSDRLLRAMFCGCVVISHKYKSIGKDFDNTENIYWYNDYADLTMSIDQLLRNKKLCNRLALNGYNNAKSNFTYTKFTTELLKLTNQYK
jgi:glycosyltransferase involved in cell wall biosynthesis